jgi:hypothetical protein
MIAGDGQACAQGDGATALVGEVRDVADERPIGGAVVRIVELDRRAITDRNGFFSFDSIPEGMWTFEASGLGYETSREASVIRERSFLFIRLQQAPIEIEGVTVSVLQRLERRRLAAPARVIAWDREELEKVVAPDVGSFIRTRGIVQFVSCGDEFSQDDLPNCYIGKGARKRLRLFIDDMEVMKAIGTSTLWAYDPRDLWSVEFIPLCAELRIYTRQFMELVESGRVRLAHRICVP